MLQDWEDGPKAGGRRKKKALKYRAQTRPREPLQGRWMFWAERGSDGRRLCQILNSYLQNKSPFSKAESDCQLRRLPASRSQSVSGEERSGPGRGGKRSRKTAKGPLGDSPSLLKRRRR